MYWFYLHEIAQTTVVVFSVNTVYLNVVKKKKVLFASPTLRSLFIQVLKNIHARKSHHLKALRVSKQTVSTPL